MKLKRMTALLLAAVMALGLLAGCGKDNGEAQGDTIVYEPTYYKMDESLQGMGQACSDGTKMYFVGYVADKEQSYVDENGETQTYMTNRDILCSSNLDGTGFQELTGYVRPTLPEGKEGSCSLNSLRVGPDGAIWVLESMYMYHYDLPENFDASTDEQWNYYVDDGNQIYLRKLNADGSEQLSVDVMGILKGLENGNSAGSSSDVDITGGGSGTYYYINSFELDKDGNVYFGGNDTNLVVCDSQGQMLFTLQDDNIGNTLVRLNDGRVACQTWGETSGLKPVDTAAKAWGEIISVPNNANNFYAGSGDYLFYYDGGVDLMGVKADGSTEKLFSWLSSDVDSDNLNGVTVISFDKVVALSVDWSGEKVDCELISMDRTEVTPENQRTNLTLAVMYLDYDLKRQVLNFNRSNKQYRIDVLDYSQYNTDDDYSAGLTKLSTEIISGKVPDIFAVNQLPIDLYGSKGLLEDLLPYIDSDTELGGREGLVQPVINAMLSGGKLYQTASSFSILTMAVNKKLVGDVTGWTVADVKEALSKLPEGARLSSYYTTQSDLLYLACAWNLDNFIDWSTGECYFDTGDFADLLEFSKLAPKEVSYDEDIDWQKESDSVAIKEGRQLISQQNIYNYYNIWDVKAIFGDDLVFVGFPTQDKQGNAFQLNGGLAMSAKCKNKDAAWQFIRTQLLDSDDNRSWQFPINQKSFDKAIKDAQTPDTYVDENGKTQYNYKYSTYDDATGKEISFEYFTDEDVQLLMNLINNTTKVLNYDEDLLNIITDEAQPFINGEKSASEVASLIQSRIKIYVNEQK